MMSVPLSDPDITQLEIDAVTAVLRSPRLSLGPKMEEFEQRLAGFVGVPYGIAVSSGTAGLHVCVRVLGLGPGDEVLVPSFTFIAAANAIRYEGATPVFVDIEPTTLNMDPASVTAAITPRTRALIVVHTFGLPARIDELLALAQRHHLRVIEDACEAIGAEDDGRRVGSFGDAAVFAFYPNKQITTGEGGMIVTRNESLAQDCRALRNQGRYTTDDWHQHSVLGFNYRLSEISCALGVAQMQRLDEILEHRAEVAAHYATYLGGIPGLLLPAQPAPHQRVSWFVYVVRLTGENPAALRDRVIRLLAEDGVQCGRYFAPIHEQPAYAGFGHVYPLPVTDAESRRTLALPFFTRMTNTQVQYVAGCLRRALAAEALALATGA